MDEKALVKALTPEIDALLGKYKLPFVTTHGDTDGMVQVSSARKWSLSGYMSTSQLQLCR